MLQKKYSSIDQYPWSDWVCTRIDKLSSTYSNVEDYNFSKSLHFRCQIKFCKTIIVGGNIGVFSIEKAFCYKVNVIFVMIVLQYYIKQLYIELHSYICQ